MRTWPRAVMAATSVNILLGWLSEQQETGTPFVCFSAFQRLFCGGCATVSRTYQLMMIGDLSSVCTSCPHQTKTLTDLVSVGLRSAWAQK